MFYTYLNLPSPLGKILVLSNDGVTLHGLYFADHKHAPTIAADWDHQPHHQIFTNTKEQLEQFVHGKRQTFTVPHQLIHGTDFQKKVWQQLVTLAYGTTISYKDLATLLSAPRATRAVGAAVARNPISIIIPCHRILGHDGKITGYAGGLGRKKFLLNLEKNRSCFKLKQS